MCTIYKNLPVLENLFKKNIFFAGVSSYAENPEKAAQSIEQLLVKIFFIQNF